MLLVRDLKRIVQDMPDDAPVLLSIGQKRLTPIREVYDYMALRDGPTEKPRFVDDLFGGDLVGEATQYGERIRAICLDT